MSARPKREHRGYYRVAEAADRKIEDSFDQPHVRRSAKLAYHTLCRIANLRGSNTFVKDLVSLARDFGYSYREAQKAIRNLESIGLLKITLRFVPDTKLKAPSCYEVVTLIQENTSIGNLGTSIGVDEKQPVATQHSQELPTKTPPKDSGLGAKKLSTWEAKTKKEAAVQALERLYANPSNKRRKKDSFETELTQKAAAEAKSLRDLIQKMDAVMLAG